MCGIAGCFNVNGNVDRERFEEVVDIIQQRVRQLPGDIYAVINVEKPYT